jgi:hypothetical protein
MSTRLTLRGILSLPGAIGGEVAELARSRCPSAPRWPGLWPLHWPEPAGAGTLR